MPIEKLLLLSCRSAFLDSDRIYPPLANLYLQSVVENNTPTRVHVTDDYSFADPAFLDGFDAVGVSIMTPQRAEAKKILDFIKHQRPKIKVIAGGPHAHYYFNDMKNEPWDHIVVQDGERAILQILQGNAPRVIDDFIPANEYKDFAVKPARLENAEFLSSFNYNLDGRRSATMMCARGCPMACTFCEDATTSTRWTPFDKIVEELDDIKSLGYRGVYIFDDLFALLQKKAEPVCRELHKRDLVYRCNGQANMFTRYGESFAELLASTGCKEIAFGHESGSQRILDNVRKKTTVEQNYNSVKYALKHGIRVKSFILLGLPGEDWDTLRDTEKFIATSGTSDFQAAVYYPYKGTQIRDAIDRGDPSNDLEFTGEGLGAYGQKGGSTECVVRTKALTREDLLGFRDYLVKTYKPHSHEAKWKDDRFFDTHLEEREC